MAGGGGAAERRPPWELNEASFQVEPSAVGEGRLLRFFLERPSQQPCWEAPPLLPASPAAPSSKDEETDGGGNPSTGTAGVGLSSPAPLLRLRKWLERGAEDASLRAPLDLLQQAGAFLLAMDKLHRTCQQHSQETPMQQRNAGAWEAAVSARDGAAQQLALGGVLLDFLLGSLHASPGVRHLRLLPAKENPSLAEVQRQVLIGLQQRAAAALPLRRALQETEAQLRGREGALAAAEWRSVLLSLMTRGWPLLKKLYQPLEFELGDGNYPYRSEVYVQLLQVPYACWEAQMDVRSHLPLPPPAPFQEHFALLRVAPHCQPRDGENASSSCSSSESPLKLRLEFPPHTGALVQRRFLLHCQIRPLLPLLGEEAGDRAASLGVCVCCALQSSANCACRPGGPSAAAVKKVSEIPEGAADDPLTSQQTLRLRGSAIPRPWGWQRRGEEFVSSPEKDGLDAAGEEVAEEVSALLEEAQWVFLDLAVFYVLASQLVQKFQEGKRVVLCKRHSSSGGGALGEGLCGTQCGSRCLSAELLAVSADAFEMLVRNVPLRRKGSGAEGEFHSHDVAITFKYAPSRRGASSPREEQSVKSGEQKEPPCVGSSGCCGCPSKVLEQFERVCVLSARQLFLETWNEEAFERPDRMAEEFTAADTGALAEIQKRQRMRLHLQEKLPAEDQQQQQPSALLQPKQRLPRGSELLSNFCQWILEALECLLADEEAPPSAKAKREAPATANFCV